MNRNSRIPKHPLFSELIELRIPNNDYAIFMSGVLFAHNLREEINDLDIIARGKSWESFSKLSEIETPISGEGKSVHIETKAGMLNIYDCWYPAEMWEEIDIIDRAVLIENLPFAQLAHVRMFKEWNGREKDLKDVKAIDSFLEGTVGAS